MARRPVAATLLAAGLLTAPAVAAGPARAAAATPHATRVLVATFPTSAFGRVLSTTNRQALYYWNQERDGRVRCTGSCAEAWPPLIVPRGVTPPRRVAGIAGTFGVVRRPDGRRQLTHNRLPLYTYVNEGRREVRCDNVNGWFVVRARPS